MAYSHLSDSELLGVYAHVTRLRDAGQPGPWDEQLVELRSELDLRGVRDRGDGTEAAADAAPQA